MQKIQSPPYQFTKASAYLTLKQLAKHPIDLTKEGQLTPERFAAYRASACGFEFLFGTERVDNEVLEFLEELAKEAKAIEKMNKMQAGAVINEIEGYPSEERQVLHTATRDFFGAPKAKEETLLAKKELDKIELFVRTLEKDLNIEDLVVIGIGGSELGPKAHYLALQAYGNLKRRVHFIGNVDPDDLAQVFEPLDLAKTYVLVISKTGTTLETKTNEILARKRFEKAKLHPEKHFLAVTQKGSPMDDTKKYAEVFYLYDWIGGRFSTTSSAGGVILSFAFGFPVFLDFLKGAHEMDQMATSESLHENLPLLGALLGIWNRNFLGYPLVALIPYSQPLLRYAAHIQQADMESNGKHIDKFGHKVDFNTGPIIFGEPGTNAQHSFYQLLHQGTTIVPMEFIGFKECQRGEDAVIDKTTSQEKLLANLFAQMIALAKGEKNKNPNKEFAGNRPSHLLIAKQLTPYTLGALLSYFENKIAFQGFMWNINSFDQEGVQLGKTLASRLTDQFASRRDSTVTKESFPLGEALIDILESI